MMRLYSVFQYAPLDDDQYVSTTTPVYFVPDGSEPTQGGVATHTFERIRPYDSHPLVIQCHYLN